MSCFFSSSSLCISRLKNSSNTSEKVCNSLESKPTSFTCTSLGKKYFVSFGILFVWTFPLQPNIKKAIKNIMKQIGIKQINKNSSFGFIFYPLLNFNIRTCKIQILPFNLYKSFAILCCNAIFKFIFSSI